MVDIINFVDVCAELAHVMRIAQHYRITNVHIRRTLASHQNMHCIERQIEQAKNQGVQYNATHQIQVVCVLGKLGLAFR
jgi:hypothetical protein